MATRTLLADGEVHDNFGPRDHGLLAWTYDPAFVSVFQTMAGGYVYLMRVVAAGSGNVTTLHFGTNDPAVGLTAAQNFAGLYSAAGSRLGLTADLKTALEATAGLKSVALTGSVAVVAGTVYYVALVQNGGTSATLMTSAIHAVLNVGLAAGSLRTQTLGPSQTSLPSSITMASTDPNLRAFWAAMS